jgi:hypothetical protein
MLHIPAHIEDSILQGKSKCYRFKAFQGETDAKCCFRGSFWPQLALYGDRGKGYNARKGIQQHKYLVLQHPLIRSHAASTILQIC